MKRFILALCTCILTGFFPAIFVAQQSRKPDIKGTGIWTRTGPFNANSPGSYSHINDGSILGYGPLVWAGSNGDGVYMSTDGGLTWRSSSNGLPRDGQGRISADAEHLRGSFSPTRSPRLYIGLPDVNNLYRSNDGGSNWTKIYRSGVPYIDSTTTSLFVANVPLFGGIEFPDKLWISVFGYSSGVYYSVNDGIDWAPFDAEGLPSKNCQFVTGKEGAPSSDPDYVFAACRSNTAGIPSVYRSLATTPHWVPLNNGLPPNLDVKVISPANKDGSRRIYLGLTNSGSNGPFHIYRSDNNGDSWVPAANGLPSNALVLDITTDVRNSNVAYAALYTDGVYKTDDAGLHWRALDNGLNTNTGKAITVGVSNAPGPPLVHLGTANGIWSITDVNTGNCSVSLNEPIQSIPSWGDEGYLVDITANSDCTWEAISSTPWVRLGTIRTGTGSAKLGFTVSRNIERTPRTGTILIGRQTLTVTQAGFNSCEYYVPFSTQNVSSVGASAAIFYIRTNSADCGWAASSTVPWITVTPPLTGYGSSAIQYNVQRNNGFSPRIGTITIGGRSLTVTQFDSGSDPCMQQRPIAFGQTLAGSLSLTDCQSESYRDYYTFRGKAGQRIAVEMEGPMFYPALNVWPSSTFGLPAFPNPGSHFYRFPYAMNSGFKTLYEPGDYIVEAKGEGIGNYTVKLIDAESVCPPTPIAPGTFSGSLTNSDCGDGGREFSDFFTFSGTEGQKVTITASSPTTDMFLVLFNETAAVAYDDNGGGGTTARIPSGSGQFTLPESGLYRIEVTSRRGQQLTGNYVLTFTATRTTRTKKLKPR